MNEDNYLIHYGVLGMKWGVRKDRKKGFLSRSSRKLTSLTKKTTKSSKSKKETPKSSKSKKKTTKRIKDMSDAELLKKRDRLRLEKEVKILETETGSTAKRVAKKAITKASEKVVEEIVHDVAKYVVGEAIINKNAGKKIVNIKSGSDDDKKKKDKS